MTYTSKGRLSKAHSGSDGDTIWSYATDGLYPTKMTDRAGLSFDIRFTVRAKMLA
ncbi:MAG: hypothetical protein HY706_11520 [Candidatus Hydrogenedentes bacterium]|nr:hypothetical protein [Candidatus Hydrogenedentota bacterium]